MSLGIGRLQKKLERSPLPFQCVSIVAKVLFWYGSVSRGKRVVVIYCTLKKSGLINPSKWKGALIFHYELWINLCWIYP